MLESGYDYIYVYDADWNEVAAFTGSDASGATVGINGETFHIRLDTDVSNTYYGYSFSQIVALEYPRTNVDANMRHFI